MNNNKKTILIVDDNEPYLLSFENAISDDFNILKASSLEQARELLNNSIDYFIIDVILDETDMNNRDGIILAKEIKEKFSDKKIILMSGYSNINENNEYKKYADFFLKKPIRINKLKELFREIEE